jgi:CHAT domain-containing protein
MHRNPVITRAIFLFCLFSFCVFSTKLYAQCLSLESVEDSLIHLENNAKITDKQKLSIFYDLKSLADRCKLPRDSVYGSLMLHIGLLEIDINNNYLKGLNYLKYSFDLNRPGKRSSSNFIAAKSTLNIAYYYNQLGASDKALDYYDTTIQITNRFPDTTLFALYSKLYIAIISFQIGNYQKTIEQSTNGISYSLKRKDSSYLLNFLIQRAQAYYYIENLRGALFDVNKALDLASIQNDAYSLASALKIKAFIFKKNRQFSKADSFFRKTIMKRVETKQFGQIANDYIDYGNFFLDSLADYKNANQCYSQSIVYGRKAEDSIILARANVNIGAIYTDQRNYVKSCEYLIQALKYLSLSVDNNFLENPTADQLNSISAKELVQVLMNNKIEILSGLYLKTGDKKYLSVCIQTALVMDTLVTKMRNMQSGIESKLYWRDFTRDLYTNAINACYLTGNFDLAFYFMEKSRAVLLNDKLNELNASSYLSKTDASKQENYDIKILELQQRLSAFADTSKQYQQIQLDLVNTRSEFDAYNKYLEQQYPVYYEYKYSDSVPSLRQLQSYLAKNHQGFVHYFTGDTATYILGITANSTRFIRLSQKEFNKNQLAQFLQLCSNKKELNNHYDVFAALSNSIYATIFEPLNLPKGRTIICMDNIVIPVEALCTDTKGKNFLLNNYSFDYVYSARFLMKQFNNPVAKGNFAGFAPVSFDSSLKVAELTNAATALKSSSSYYSNNKLFTHENATRNNFFSYAASYSIVNIFSHAKADTTDDEPVLYMQDAVIHLSELQRLNNPATKLVLLSACQTNVGKTATGEGIYSLARGFAAAGISSVSATLWNADEETIYSVSNGFNKYLSKGMNKDEALQKAKLDFINNNDKEKMLPYYWANMILIGNADAIKLQSTNTYLYTWFIIAAVVICIGAIFLLRRKNYKAKN